MSLNNKINKKKFIEIHKKHYKKIISQGKEIKTQNKKIIRKGNEIKIQIGNGVMKNRMNEF